MNIAADSIWTWTRYNSLKFRSSTHSVTSLREKGRISLCMSIPLFEPNLVEIYCVFSSCLIGKCS